MPTVIYFFQQAVSRCWLCGKHCPRYYNSGDIQDWRVEADMRTGHLNMIWHIWEPTGVSEWTIRVAFLASRASIQKWVRWSQTLSAGLQSIASKCKSASSNTLQEQLTMKGTAIAIMKRAKITMGKSGLRKEKDDSLDLELEKWCNLVK